MAITIEEVFLRIIFPYQKYIIITSIFIVFIVALWIYRWKSIYPVIFSDVANESETNNNNDDDDGNILTFYYVKWCPYCIKTKSIFGIKDVNTSNFIGGFANTYNNKLINDHKLICNLVDCEETPEKCGNIDTYPTIQLLHNGITYDFEDYEITSKSLYDFVNTITQIE
jgi:hypothetical protein